MARIYFLERMTLAELFQDNSNRPLDEDVVVYLREAQLLAGEEGAFWRSRGNCFNGETLLSYQESESINHLLCSLYLDWNSQLNGNQECADANIIAKSIATFFTVGTKMTIVIRRAEILRKLFAKYSDCETVFTDIQDGLTCFGNLLGKNLSNPQRTVLEEVGNLNNVKIIDLNVKNPVPPCHHTTSDWQLKKLGWVFIGGFRLKYLYNRIIWRFKKKVEKRVYVFHNRALELISKQINQKNGGRVFSDTISNNNIIGVRHDHILPVFSIPFLLSSLKFLRQFNIFLRNIKNNEQYFYNNYDYSRVLTLSLSQTVKSRLLYAMIKICQSRALIKNYQIDLVVINGETAQMLSASQVCKKAIFVDHGMNLFSNGPCCNSGCQENLTYVVCGDDHLLDYGRGMAQHKRPQTIVLSNPGISVMDSIKGKWNYNNKNRILLSNFSPNYDTTASRYFKHDNFMADLFDVVKILTQEGFKFTYRGHLGEDPSYQKYFCEKMGVDSILELENSNAFSEALVDHGVFVGNASSCVYQALYAGWPTIFYEPQFNKKDFIGLPAATDFTPPLADSRDKLIELIRATQDTESWISKFPKEFNSKYSKRFIGPNSDRAGAQIADYISAELV